VSKTVLKTKRNIARFSPFRRLDWFIIYALGTAVAVVNSVSVISALLRFGVRGGDAAVNMIGPSWFFNVITFLITFFYQCSPSTDENGAGVLIPLIFSLVLTTPVFLVDGYVIYLLWR